MLSETPVAFTIHSSQREEVITVKMGNAPVMGKISVKKLGEMLSGVREVDTAFGKQLPTKYLINGSPPQVLSQMQRVL